MSGTPFFRFSLTALFGVVLFVAVGTAAIRYASPLWTGITLALALPILFIAVLGALFALDNHELFGPEWPFADGDTWSSWLLLRLKAA